METKAYLLAEKHECIAPRKSEKIAMTELFDYFAGSETGAIIGATLLIKNDDQATLSQGQKNKYFADTTVEWFNKNIETLYRDTQMPRSHQIMLVLFLTAIFSFLVYHFTEKHNIKPDYDEKIDVLNQWFNEFELSFFQKNHKDYHMQIKKLTDDLMQLCVSDYGFLGKQNNKKLTELMESMKKKYYICEEDDAQGTLLEAEMHVGHDVSEIELFKDMTRLEQKVRQHIDVYNKKQNYKWIGLVLSIVIFFPFFMYLSQGVSFLFYATKDTDVLEKEVLKLIPKGYNMNDINEDVDDFMVLSWDLNNRKPRFFNKWAYNTLGDSDVEQRYDFTLDEMVMASAANLMYYHPYKKSGEIYISGDNVAKMPAMYAAFAAMEKSKDH